MPDHKSPKHYGLTDKEAVAMRKRYLRDVLNKMDYRLATLKKALINSPEKEKNFIRLFINDILVEIDKITRNILFLKSTRRSKEIDIVLIKQIPIKQVLEYLGYRSDARGWYKCMFHEEKSGSFHLVPGKNTFKCFGCSATGSVIDLVMHSQKLNVGGAVKYLSTFL